MGWLKGIWAEIVAAGVLAVLSTCLVYLRDLDPLALGAMIFALILVAFIIMAKVQEKNIKKKLQIDRERWNKLREEKIKLRQSYAKCTEIPNLLYKMSERSRTLIEGFDKSQINKGELNSMLEDFAATLNVKPKEMSKRKFKSGADAINAIRAIPKLRRYKGLDLKVRALALFLQGSMGAHKFGTMQLTENDPEYQDMYKVLRELQVGLPKTINIKVESHVEFANAFNNVFLFDFATFNFPPEIKTSVPFFKTGVHSLLEQIRSEIADLIERFLSGDDIK